ncbi:MAG: hypothetical protein WD576_03140, partial [Nitriliruptoraceae bacterium]
VLRDEADAVAPPPSARTGRVTRIPAAVPGTREADAATSADDANGDTEIADGETDDADASGP